MTEDNLEEFTEKNRPLNSINIRFVNHRRAYLLEYVGDSDAETEVVEGETLSRALKNLAERVDK